MKKRIVSIIAAFLILAMTCASGACAEFSGSWDWGTTSSAEDFSFGDDSWDAFEWEDFESDDLGDESMPLMLLCGVAVLTASGLLIVHKKRKCAE